MTTNRRLDAVLSIVLILFMLIGTSAALAWDPYTHSYSGDQIQTNLYWNQIPLAKASVPVIGSASYTLFLPLVTRSVKTVGAASPIDGSTANCNSFVLSFLFGLGDFDFPEPGWVWVNAGQKFRSVSGVVTGSEVTHTDFPAVHDSHDQNTDLLVDLGQEDVTSDANDPGEIEMEWEIGTFPSETGSDPERTFPKWAWPSVGDRVWINGHWIFDCGHPTSINGSDHFRTEIHPARAIASMRDQLRPLPGTGTSPVRVTATDLYIHGHAGFVTDDLECGQNVILGLGSCDSQPYPHRGTPIDENFDFDVCLPPKPSPSALLATLVEDGPGNNVAVNPVLTPGPAAGACAGAGFGPQQVHVTVPLAGSGVTPDSVYARKIYAGWIYPPNGLKHLRLTLTSMDLHQDTEPSFFDGEFTFFWMNVDRAQSQWFRLQGHDIPTDDHAGIGCFQHTNTLNDWDDDISCGNGELNFGGPTFDYFVANGQSYTVRANGYDQDCLDDRFGHYQIGFEVGGTLVPNSNGLALADCFIESGPITGQTGDNDEVSSLTATFGPPGYGVGAQDIGTGDYNMRFNVENIPITNEDSADLGLIKACKPDNVAQAGQQIICTILVDNPGPGLPRNVIVKDTLLTNVDPSRYTTDAPLFTFSGLGGSAAPCDPTQDISGGKQFQCNLGTVPIGSSAIITVHITSTESGDFNNYAKVSTDSNDPDAANNQGQASVHVTPVADLSIIQSDSPDPVDADTRLTYTLGITNNGLSTAVNVIVEDMLPAGVSVASVTGSGATSCHFGVPGDTTRPTVCTYGTLAPSATAAMTIVVTVDPGISRVLHNDASVRSEVFDPDNSNNFASQDTTIKVADLKIVKTSDADVYSPSSTVKYTISVINNGPSDAANIVVTDILPDSKQAIYVFDTGGCSKSGLTLTCNLGALSAGGSKSFNVYVTIRGSKGQVINRATVASSTVDPDSSNNSSTRVVLIKGGIK